MVVSSDKGSSESEDMKSQSSQTSQISTTTTTTTNNKASSGNSHQQVKTCVDCGTSKTPLWRGGPAGPKSLCNACGIKSRKKRRALLGLNKEEKKTKKIGTTVVDGKGRNSNEEISSTSGSGCSSNGVRCGGSLMKRKLFDFGREVVAFQRPRSNTTQRRKLGEVEQAAILLMALSCGSVYA